MRGAFFDIDQTVIRGNSQSGLAFFLFLKGFFCFKSLGYFLLWALGAAVGVSFVSGRRVREICYSVFNRRSASEIEMLLTDFCEYYIRKNIISAAVSEIDVLRRSGVKIIFVSATLQQIGDYVSRILKGDYCFCTKLEKNDDCYDGRLSGDIVEGRAKETIIKEFAIQMGLDLKESYAYGDSIHDRYMLETVGYPTAVNPDKKLENLALLKKWRIELW